MTQGISLGASLLRWLSFIVLAAMLAGPRPIEAQEDDSITRWVVAPHGNEARYLVREQLMRRDLPNDAVGVTSRVEGGLAVDATGAVVASGSRFVIDLTDLTSDAERRDRFIKRNTLATDSFPTAVFVPTAFEGVVVPPDHGQASFRVRGDLTIRGVTREVTWDATARREDEDVVGTASTRFPFATFGLEIPRLGFILSVDDDIRLEYDFRLVPGG